MDLGIDGRTALVIGASRGIGRGIAAALVREGVKVALASRSKHALEATAREIGGTTAVFVADNRDLDRLRGLPAEVEATLGPVDILVTNSAGPAPGAALDNGIGEWHEAFETLVLAPRFLIEAAIGGMRERGWGRIVNVSSRSVREPIPGLTLSNANRMAAHGFFKTLSREVARDGVTVNTVATGMFGTERAAELHGGMEAAEAQAAEQVPAGRLGVPDEYGDLVAFLCSERAAYLTGALVPLDGGLLRSA